MGDQPPSSNFDRHKWKGKCNQVIDILGFFTKLNSLSHATERERVYKHRKGGSPL